MIGRGRSHAAGRDWFGLEHFRPGPEFATRGSVCALLESVDSTSDFLLGRGEGGSGRRCFWDGWGWRADALEILRPAGGPRPGRIAVARHQRRGRGRRGRSWRDTGGLFLSWTATVREAAVENGLAVWLGLIAARALREEFAVPVELKWPNDLYCGGRKLGGLILDRVGQRGGGTDVLVVAGLGLNVDTEPAALPAELQGRITSLAQHRGSTPPLGELAGVLLAAFGRRIVDFQRRGWSPFRRDLERLDLLRDRRVEVETGDGIVAGVGAGIDDDGALVVETAEGRLALRSSAGVHVVMRKE